MVIQCCFDLEFFEVENFDTEVVQFLSTCDSFGQFQNMFIWKGSTRFFNFTKIELWFEVKLLRLLDLKINITFEVLVE